MLGSDKQITRKVIQNQRKNNNKLVRAQLFTECDPGAMIFQACDPYVYTNLTYYFSTFDFSGNLVCVTFEESIFCAHVYYSVL